MTTVTGASAFLDRALSADTTLEALCFPPAWPLVQLCPLHGFRLLVPQPKDLKVKPMSHGHPGAGLQLCFLPLVLSEWMLSGGVDGCDWQCPQLPVQAWRTLEAPMSHHELKT